MYDCQQLQLMYQIHQVKNDNDYTSIKSRIKEEKKWWYGTGVNMSKKLQHNRPARSAGQLRQNDVATSFWRNKNVIIAVCVRWIARTIYVVSVVFQIGHVLTLVIVELYATFRYTGSLYIGSRLLYMRLRCNKVYTLCWRWQLFILR